MEGFGNWVPGSAGLSLEVVQDQSLGMNSPTASTNTSLGSE